MMKLYLGLAAAMAVGCAAPVEKEASTAAAFEGESNDAAMADGTVYLKVDNHSVWYDKQWIYASVCDTPENADLVARLRDLRQNLVQPHLVIEMPDGTWDSRVSEMPRENRYSYACNNGTEWLMQLWDQNVDHIKDMNLSGMLSSNFGGSNFACEAGFQITHLDVDVKNFFVKDGALTMPDVTLDLTAESTAQVSAGCTFKVSSGTKVAFAGVVPIVYEVELGIGVQVSAEKATTLHAHIDKNGVDVDSGGITFKVTPSVQLGVSFYKVVGGYARIDAPISITPKAPCSPEISWQIDGTLGAKAGIDFGSELKISKGISVEASQVLFGPVMLPSVCQ